jgi:hypothetical protein
MKVPRRSEEVDAAVRAARWWWNDADLPDPLRVADFGRRPDLLLNALNRREQLGWMLGQPVAVPFPKLSGAFRTMVRLDPIADVHARLVVAPATALINAALAREVIGPRPHQTGPAWCVHTPRADHRLFRKARSRLGDDNYAVLHTDIADHFGTVTASHLQTMLCSAMVPDGTVQGICELLEELHEVPGMPSGLPAGPEFASPLGMIALAAIDRSLLAQGFPMARWMDDLAVGAASRELAAEALKIILATARRQGQTLNPAKTQISAGISIETLGGYGIDDGDFVSEDPVGELMEIGESGDITNAARILGQLAQAKDPDGLRAIRAVPMIGELLPKQTRRYVREVAEQPRVQSWIREQVLAPTTTTNAALQSHLLGELQPQEIDGADAAMLFERGVALQQDHPVLGDWYIAIAGRSGESGHIRGKRALELAHEPASLNTRRACTTAFERGGTSSRARKGLRHLSRIEPDAAAAVARVAG